MGIIKYIIDGFYLENYLEQASTPTPLFFSRGVGAYIIY